ncbi:MAG: hypothetical protein M3R01_02915, partial [Actinomycetota bacterium]|nr:hypothetical protein [Actinomycetota bacterium]
YGEPVGPEGPEGEATAAFALAEMQALAEDGAGDDDDDASGDDDPASEARTDADTATVDVREQPAGNGALAAAAVDDPFLAELRRAVSDDEPLGPRTGLEQPHELYQPELAGSGSRRRRRKRSTS